MWEEVQMQAKQRSTALVYIFNLVSLPRLVVLMFYVTFVAPVLSNLAPHHHVNKHRSVCLRSDQMCHW